MKKIVLPVFYFLFSTIITWWFIKVFPLYTSSYQMILSCGIAGAKWGIQIIAGILFLKEKSLEFLTRIGYTCFIGSCILIPYCISGTIGGNTGEEFFVGSLIASVLTMIYLYYKAVIKTGLSLFWWIGWLLCLFTAITLQLTLVFKIL